MVEFDFSKLSKLADEAKKAANEAGTYAGDLEKKIRNPISSYSGKHTGNINTAYDKVRMKATRMRQKADSLNSYSNKVTSFINTAQTAENRLTNRISSLLGSFKKRWDIKEPSFLESLIEGFCDLIGLGDLYDAFRGFLKDLKAYFKHIFAEISDWYHFDGGAELIDAIVAIVTTVALVILDIALVILTDGAWLAVIIGALAAAVSMYNAIGKISQYMETFGSDHVLHMSANNKISSETDFASWLRRNGQYEAAVAFQVIEFVSAIASMIYGFASFAKNVKNVIKTQSGHFFQNVFKSIKEGGAKLFKVKETKDAYERAGSIVKVIKNYVKISNGIYQMIRTNNFGKNDGKAFWDTIKAGKDTWDTLINGTLGNMFNFKYTDKRTGEAETQKALDIVNDYLKQGVTGTNKIWSVINHKNLNLNNFKYDANIDKPTDNVDKIFNTIGSPSKFMQYIAGKIGNNYAIGSVLSTGTKIVGHTVQAGFQLSFTMSHPWLGIPVLAYEMV